MKYKTTIATIAGAILVYAQAKGWLGNDEAIFVSQVLMAVGISVNLYTNRKK